MRYTLRQPLVSGKIFLENFYIGKIFLENFYIANGKCAKMAHGGRLFKTLKNNCRV